MNYLNSFVKKEFFAKVLKRYFFKKKDFPERIDEISSTQLLQFF